MYFFYLDEAGNSGFNLDDLNQPIHFVSGVSIHLDKIQEIEKKINALFAGFLPYSQNYDFEFHGVDVFEGKKYFKNFKCGPRLNVFSEFLKIAQEGDVKFFSQGINKKRHKEKYIRPYHPHNVAFMYLIEKLEIFLSKKKAHGIVIMDKCKETEQDIINDFRYYKNSGTKYGSFKREIDHFIDNVFYVESYNSLLLQLSDMLNYIHSSSYVNELRGNNTTSHRKFLINLAEQMKVFTEYFAIDPS
ncbi:MAG TPA: DUF3800 domain-containing protein [Candidatus Portnoybacteria bacterium]|nr:DUF3800 domain-containing protein [Candidatus Portnoybacteria bacterium]